MPEEEKPHHKYKNNGSEPESNECSMEGILYVYFFRHQKIITYIVNINQYYYLHSNHFFPPF
jgi:hypothetical protein